VVFFIGSDIIPLDLGYLYHGMQQQDQDNDLTQMDNHGGFYPCPVQT
jgi:hypothetical protein